MLMNTTEKWNGWLDICLKKLPRIQEEQKRESGEKREMRKRKDYAKYVKRHYTKSNKSVRLKEQKE